MGLLKYYIGRGIRRLQVYYRAGRPKNEEKMLRNKMQFCQQLKTIIYR